MRLVCRKCDFEECEFFKHVEDIPTSPRYDREIQPRTQVRKETKINDLVIWTLHKLDEFGGCELEAMGIASLTLCHVVTRLQKWGIPFEYSATIGFYRKDERSIKPYLRVRLWILEGKAFDLSKVHR